MPLSALVRYRAPLSWAPFAILVVGVFGYAIRVHRAAPFPAPVQGEPGPDGARFGLTEARRRAMFQELVRGEPADRAKAAREREGVIHVRNSDDFFHELEALRVQALARRHRLPLWQAYLILDEGLRAHWPPPPGVELRADDQPYRVFTRPFNQRPLIVAGPPAAIPPPPTAAPAPPAATTPPAGPPPGRPPRGVVVPRIQPKLRLPSGAPAAPAAKGSEP
jgi:hypothetical protein